MKSSASCVIRTGGCCFPTVSLAMAFKEITVSGLPWWSSGYDSMLLLLGVQVQSLVWKLRSHMPRGVAKNLKKKKKSLFLRPNFTQLNMKIKDLKPLEDSYPFSSFQSY